jgi:CRP-like cAMP-binding protein
VFEEGEVKDIDEVTKQVSDAAEPQAPELERKERKPSRHSTSRHDEVRRCSVEGVLVPKAVTDPERPVRIASRRTSEQSQASQGWGSSATDAFGTTEGNFADIGTRIQGEKTQDDEEFITNALESNETLTYIIPHSQNFIKSILDVIWKVEVVKGMQMCQGSDSDSRHFYIVERGLIQGVDVEGCGDITIFKKGCCFGESALLGDEVPAKLLAEESSTLWVVDLADFWESVSKDAKEKIQNYRACLDCIKIFESLSEVEKETVAKALNTLHYDQGDFVFEPSSFTSRTPSSKIKKDSPASPASNTTSP